jgi:hypothetical protein
MHVQSPTIPDDLKEGIEGLGALATVDDMPLDYQRWAFLFIEQSGNPSTRDFRVSNFLEVVEFFHQNP